MRLGPAVRLIVRRLAGHWGCVHCLPSCRQPGGRGSPNERSWRGAGLGTMGLCGGRTFSETQAAAVSCGQWELCSGPQGDLVSPTPSVILLDCPCGYYFGGAPTPSVPQKTPHPPVTACMVLSEHACLPRGPRAPAGRGGSVGELQVVSPHHYPLQTHPECLSGCPTCLFRLSENLGALQTRD